jgi:hypothetical protein
VKCPIKASVDLDPHGGNVISSFCNATVGQGATELR